MSITSRGIQYRIALFNAHFEVKLDYGDLELILLVKKPKGKSAQEGQSLEVDQLILLTHYC